MAGGWSLCWAAIWMPNSAVFDPFGDFETAGYLRNVRGDKDPAHIKHFEHNFFRGKLPDALEFLASRESLTYRNFLNVHRILFSDYYPWAGQDRATTLPDRAVSKGGVKFSHPYECRRAVEYGLRLGHDTRKMNEKCGEVMGLFAFGHPFLEGNGRTMLLVHYELCHRAGFSIAWEKTKKADYLAALSEEIDAPGKGILDAYLLPFKAKQFPRTDWGTNLLSIKGLDGLDEEHEIEGYLTDPAVVEKYREINARRQHYYSDIPPQPEDGSP